MEDTGKSKEIFLSALLPFPQKVTNQSIIVRMSKINKEDFKSPQQSPPPLMGEGEGGGENTSEKGEGL